MELEKKISTGIMEAMKAKDDVKRDTLRNVKKMIIEAKTAGPNIDELPDAEVLKIINKLAKQGTDSAEIFKQQGRNDLYEYEIDVSLTKLQKKFKAAFGSDKLQLDKRVVYVHGVPADLELPDTVGGCVMSYDAHTTLPIAAGEIEKA